MSTDFNVNHSGSQESGVSSTPNVSPSNLANLINQLAKVEVEVSASDFEQIFGKPQCMHLWSKFMDCDCSLLRFWSLVDGHTRNQLIDWLNCRLERILAVNGSDSKKNSSPVSCTQYDGNPILSELDIPPQDALKLADILWEAKPYFGELDREDCFTLMGVYSQLFRCYAQQKSLAIHIPVRDFRECQVWLQRG